jgi:5-methylcytosine-specific restriction endonuclease McrA
MSAKRAEHRRNDRAKRSMPSCAVIARYWADWEMEHGTFAPWAAGFWDHYEPSCMACGMPKFGIDPDVPTFNTWNKAGFQRCHVVPRYLDGPDEPHNLVLMCHSCHEAQPDSGDPAVTWAYMRDRHVMDTMSARGYVTVRNGTMEVTAKAHHLMHAAHYVMQMGGHDLPCPCQSCEAAGS